MHLETQRARSFQFLDQHHVFGDGQTVDVGTRMASRAQRTHTKHFGRLLAARRLHEKKNERLKVRLIRPTDYSYILVIFFFLSIFVLIINYRNR